MRLIINGHDFDWEFALARARIYENINRRIAAAKAAGRPHPGRSAGQFLRWMRVHDLKGAADDGIDH